ncbi:MAG: ComEC/Rec2 family competence protein [Clostridia bacterium]|nr:ComEC/Rec2 family competence protein [Clostridia bacterium]
MMKQMPQRRRGKTVKLFQNKPYAVMLLSFFVASCFFAAGTFLTRMIAVTAALAALTVFLLLPAPEKEGARAGRYAAKLSLSAVLVAGLLSAAAWDGYAAYVESRAGQEDEIEAEIVGTEYAVSYSARYRVKIRSSAVLPRGTVVLIDTDAGYELGDYISGQVRYAEIASSGGVSKKNYSAERIFLRGEEGSFSRVGRREGFSLSAAVTDLRASLASTLVAVGGKEAGGLGAALLVGDRSGIGDSFARDMRRIGMGHLLVISGTHFSVLITFLALLLRRLPLKLKRGLRAGILGVLIVCFMVIAGGTPSVLRAGIMCLFVQLGVLVRRRSDPVHAFAAAGALLVVVNPFSAADCGLQLSFAATYACLVYLNSRPAMLARIREKTGLGLGRGPLRILRYFLEIFLLSTWITLNTLPLIWLYFGEIPLLSVLANAVFIPLVTVYLHLTAIVLLLSPLYVFAAPSAFLMNAGYGLISHLASSLSSLGGIVLNASYAAAGLFLVPAALLLLAAPLFAHKPRRCLLAGAGAFLALFFAVTGVVLLAQKNTTAFTYLTSEKGKNEGFVLRADGKVLLCDMSDGSASFGYLLTEEASRMRVSEIDALALTHLHAKHRQLVEKLCARELVRTVILPEAQNEKERLILLSLEDAAREAGVEVLVVSSGETADFHGVGLTILPRATLSRSTHPVSGALLDLPAQRLALVSSSFSESPTAADAALSADILILGRHSPVYKKTFVLTFDHEPKAVFASADALAFMEEETKAALGSHLIPLGGEPCRLTFGFRADGSKANTEPAPASP